MTESISADYTLRPSELASTLAVLVEARQPVMVWGPPGAAKSQIAQQVATDAGRQYVDVRALLLDPVDLRGIPWRDSSDRTRWAPPAFLPPTDDAGQWLINLEELPSAVPMVQAALYQLVLDRSVGEYELPEGASIIACGNRESDRGVVHRMPTPLASRFVHLEIRVRSTGARAAPPRRAMAVPVGFDDFAGGAVWSRRPESDDGKIFGANTVRERGNLLIFIYLSKKTTDMTACEGVRDAMVCAGI